MACKVGPGQEWVPGTMTISLSFCVGQRFLQGNFTWSWLGRGTGSAVLTPPTARSPFLPPSGLSRQGWVHGREDGS